MGDCRIDKSDRLYWYCDEHQMLVFYHGEGQYICMGRMREERDAAITERDALAARLAQAEAQAQRLDAERIEAIMLISTWRESFQEEVSKRCDVEAQLNALRRDYHALVSRARGLEERAQCLGDALRTLLAEMETRKGRYIVSCCRKAQAVLDSLEREAAQ